MQTPTKKAIYLNIAIVEKVKLRFN